MNIQIKDIRKIFEDRESFLKEFKRDTYEAAFERFGEKNSTAFQEIAIGISAQEGYEETMSAVCGLFVEAARALLDTVDSKAKKEEMQMKLNMFMAIYVLPTILENKNGHCKELTEMLCKAWGDSFKNSNIKASEFSKIKEGFRSKLCYITTAVCESLDKPEDCYELNLLKNYRDGYLMETDDGEALIHEYYDIAPTIVKRINKSEDSSGTYAKIWSKYLKPCVSLIEEGKNEECKELYMDMVYKLRDRYMNLCKVSADRH